MTALLFLGISLASYRLWKLLAKDVIFDKWRKAFFMRFPPDGVYAKLANKPRTRYVGVFVSCPWCSGFWISGAVVFAVSCFQPMSLPILWWFAASTAVGLIAKLDG